LRTGVQENYLRSAPGADFSLEREGKIYRAHITHSAA
jgi:hypothetical protein